MRRHWRIFREFFRTCLVEELEYRSEFIGNFLSSLLGIGVAILTIQIFFYRSPTEDSHLKECEGRSPMSRWEMNVGWR